MDELQNRIRYHFKSVQLLEEALHPAGTSPLQGNKQLGLVGDSVLSISILDGWYDSKKKKISARLPILPGIWYVSD